MKPVKDITPELCQGYADSLRQLAAWAREADPKSENSDPDELEAAADLIDRFPDALWRAAEDMRARAEWAVVNEMAHTTMPGAFFPRRVNATVALSRAACSIRLLANRDQG